MMNSVWLDTASIPNKRAMRADLQTDVFIIGGGIAGILCVYQLGQAGASYILVEADAIYAAVSPKTRLLRFSSE